MIKGGQPSPVFNGRYMMATAAHHKMGDLSREEPTLCYVMAEDEGIYRGIFVQHFLSFVDVEFPKATTRQLTEEELKKYDGMNMPTSHGYYTMERRGDELVASQLKFL
jgi:hypothetical protein